MITMLKNLIISFLLKRLEREIEKLEKKLLKKRKQLQEKVINENTEI